MLGNFSGSSLNLRQIAGSKVSVHGDLHYEVIVTACKWIFKVVESLTQRLAGHCQHVTDLLV